MNYYERHIGDYLKDTAHLSLLEHGIYTRLMDVYYTREGAIPAAEAARLIGARSKEEREALAAVLAEFFVVDAGAHRQDRCEREIERFRDKQNKARASADARWSKPRAHTGRNANASPDAMRTHSEGNAPRARPQTPDTRHQSKSPPTPGGDDGDTDAVTAAPSPAPGPAPAPAEAPPEQPQAASAARSPYAAVCIALRQAGIAAVNPSHPLLRTLVDAGATVEEFAAAVPKAAGKGDAFAYVLACVEGARKRAAATAGQLHQGAMPGQEKPEEDPEFRTRASVERLAAQHGLSRWDECETFDTYRGRVLRRAGAEPRRAAA